MANRAIKSPAVYLDPEAVQNAASELASKVRLVSVGMAEFSACDKLVYAIFYEDHDFKAMLDGKFDMEKHNG